MRVSLSDIFGNIWIPITVAVSELCAGNEKPIGALFEQKKPPSQIYPQIVHDEILEPFWETFFSSMLVRVAKVLTPGIPQFAVIFPSKLFGAAWHWSITSHQSVNVQHSAGEKEDDKKSISADFFETIVKKPTNLFLKLCGIEVVENNKEEEQVKVKKCNFLRYGLTQLGIFSLAGFALKHADDENLPGVDIDSDDPLSKNIFKTIGYSVVEQLTYCLSHTIRFYKDFKEQFNPNYSKKWIDKIAFGKSLANIINEKLIPGHFLSAIGGSLSTYYFGKIIPRTTAALLGEFPLKILNRTINCHRRRATKYCIKEENGKKYYDVGEDNQPLRNHRFNTDGFNGLLNVCDLIFEPVRTSLNKLVSKVFNIKYEELEESFTINRPKGKPATT